MEKEVVKPDVCLKRNSTSSYLEDYPVISKLDNPEVILEFIKMAKEDHDVDLTMDDVPKFHVYVYKHSKKSKVATSEVRKET